jgi:hypothetical protein
MYKIRGSDQKEYGPVSAEVLKQWIAEGRVNGQTSVLAEGGALWKSLASFPEFSDALGTSSPPPVPGRMAPSAPAAVGPAKTCGMAIASLILGLLGCFGITALIGLILGIMALVKIKNSQGRLSGQGLAIAGVCVSGFMLLMIPFWAGLTLPAFARAKGKAQTINCISNLKMMSLGMRIYASDHNDTLPAAANWCDAIQASMAAPKAFVCPSDHSHPRCSYTFNRRLSGLKVDQVNPQTVMVFEGRGGWNVSGGRGDMVTHHQGIYTVGFADGSVQQVTAARLGTLRWDP